MVIPKFHVKVRNDSKATVYSEVLLYQNGVYVDKTAGYITANSTRTFTIDYIPPASTSPIIDYWLIEVYADGRYFGGRKIYTPKASKISASGFGSVIVQYNIRLNGYKNLDKATFYVGFSLGYKRWWDMPPVRITYDNGNVYLYAEGTGDSDSAYVGGDFTLSIEVGYTGTYVSAGGYARVKASNDDVSDVKSKIGITSPDWGKYAFALWHGYDGTLMHGCFYYDKSDIWLAIY